MKAIITNLKNYNESKVNLELVENKYNDLPTYAIKGRKTIWGTPKKLYMEDNKTGHTTSARGVRTRYLVDFIEK
jgi:hypothetical protein